MPLKHSRYIEMIRERDAVIAQLERELEMLRRDRVVLELAKTQKRLLELEAENKRLREENAELRLRLERLEAELEKCFHS